MNTKKYLQTDSAWSGLGYPSYPCNVGRDGCGMVSIANILIEMEQYAQYTPATIQPYCRQYAAPNCDGTYWAGIPKMLSHYGLTEVMEHQNMSSLWAELAKGDRVAVYMMGSSPGGSLGVHWTSGGHFICSVGYRYQDGDHQVYVKDSYSNSNLRNGWVGYSTHLRGDVRAVWSGKLVGTPTPPPTPPKPGQLVVDGIGGTETVMAMQQAFGVTIDGEISGQLTKWSNYYPSITAISFGGGGSQTIWKLQEWLNLSDPDGILGPNTTKAWQKRLRDYGYFANPQETIDGIIGAKTMKAWQECLNNGLKPKSQPTPPTPSGGEHYPGPYPVVKRYLEPGDKGENVTRLQNYLNWYTDGAFFKECGGADGIYGNNTLKYVKKMQTDFFGASEADGLVGNKTINKMQAYEKPVKPQPVPPTPPKPTVPRVIDVSYVQTSINWDKVKASGIEGAMVRCGYRGYETGRLNEDDMFMSHIKGASKAGLKVGVYFFTEAINYAEGREEAEFTLKLIEKAGIDLYYPIAVDTEYIGEDDEGVIPRADNISKSARTNAIKGFCDVIKERGGQPMIYASLNWFDTHLDMSKLPFDVWCAQYYHKCEYEGKYLMWQYTSKGSVEGVKGVVDMNECYITSPAPKPTPEPVPPTPDPKGYTGSLPTEAEIREASSNGIKRGIIIWDKEIADSGKYRYVTFDEQTQCPICHPRDYDLGWQCIGYDFASWRHGGGIPCNCWYGVLYNSLGDRYYNMSDAEVLASMKSRIGVDEIKLIRNNNKQIPQSMLEIGDLLMFYNGKTFIHMGVYVGNGKISDAANKTDGIRYGVPYTDFKCLFAIRYTGTRSYMKQGDEGKAVLEWQDFLDWWSDGAFYKECGKGDGVFGANTHKYTVAFQEKEMGKGQGDGTVGMKTITAAKKVVK